MFSRFRNVSYKCSAPIGRSVMFYSLYPSSVNIGIFQFEAEVREISALKQKIKETNFAAL